MSRSAQKNRTTKHRLALKVIGLILILAGIVSASALLLTGNGNMVSMAACAITAILGLIILCAPGALLEAIFAFLSM